jgi:predicted O-methyltransferase YrrM
LDIIKVIPKNVDINLNYINNSILEEVFINHSFKNSSQELIKIHSYTSLEQCLFLQKIIKDNDLKKGIEIGLAYGISSLAIVNALKSNNGHKHVIIDKFQHESWGGNGLDILKQAGLDSLIDFRENYSYVVLPELLKSGEKFDFAYIDSTKQFDFILNDFFYLDKLMEVDGIIIFDDLDWPGIKKVARFVARLPHYEVYDQYPKNKPQSDKKFYTRLSKIFPSLKKVLRNDHLYPDASLKINSNCVAFRKKENDARNWDWFKDF